MKFGTKGQLTEVITFVKYLVDWFRGYGVIAISHWLNLQRCSTAVRHCDLLFTNETSISV